MYTRCPECSTCFRVTDRHLAIAKGKVRCGKCQFIFNAPEHAIDDLPVNQITEQAKTKPATPITPPPVKAETKKPADSVHAEKNTAAPPVEKEVKVTKPAKTEKPKNTNVTKSTTSAPVFKADATMIADISSLNKNDLDSINLDSPSNSHDETDDDLFDDSFDLNAAIDELTQSTDDDASDEKLDIDDTATQTEAEKYIPEKDNNGDVFDTDAYEATNATSVADILNEMEGQLSLNIGGPNNNDKKEKKYDANNEFDFLKLDEDLKDEQSNDESINENTVDEFEIIEFSEDDEKEEKLNQEDHYDIELSEDNAGNETKKDSLIDEDELFDQIDLSDFEDSEVEDKIVIEEPAVDNADLKNIGQHANDSEVPFQLRNDIEHLNAPSRRLFSPLFTIPFVILLLLLSFSQLTYFRAHELVNLVPSARPVLEAFCETTGCYYSGPRDTKQIQLLSRDVRLHPKEKKALLISAAMINNAYFAQPYPDIHIRLSDISGNVVAERIFNAKTYMGQLSNPFLLMKSKTPVHINFEVVDPGKDAINFEFTFL